MHHEPQQAVVVPAPVAAPHAQQPPPPPPPQMTRPKTTGFHPASSHQATANGQQQVVLADQQPTRLTLPLRDSNLLGPFKLDHNVNFISKVFHIKQQLFDTLSKSFNLISPQTATVIHELQFRAYLVNNNQKQQQQHNSSCAGNHHHQHQNNNSLNGGDSLLASSPIMGRACNWPELFQVSINQNVVQLDRTKGSHKAVDIFQFCQPGDNIIEIQVSDCYCNHEFILEAVERPTLKAFMNSCYKTRQLNSDMCISKLRCNFGQPGFIVNHQQQNNQLNEYITTTSTEFNNGSTANNDTITKVKISLKCPLTQRRIRTPIRGPKCVHLQCFDLESFLYVNREKTQWTCPLCSLAIPFPSIELDQHQMNIIQTLSNEPMAYEEILIDQNGSWQVYSTNYGPSISTTGQQQQSQQELSNSIGTVGFIQNQQSTHQNPNHHQSQNIHHNHQATTAKSTGTYHPQPVGASHGSPQQPLRPMSGPMISTSSAAGGRSTLLGSPLAATSASGGWPANSSNSMEQQQQALQRPASAQHQQLNMNSPIRCSPSNPNMPIGSPQLTTTTKKGPASYQYNHPVSVNQNKASTPNPFNHNDQQQQQQQEDLSPLAAMERAIIQHEQQMKAPPFDPNSLTTASSSPGSSLAQQQTTRQQVVSNSEHNTPARINNHQFSPAAPQASPAPDRRGTNIVPASPQQQQQQQLLSSQQQTSIPPQSPMTSNNNPTQHQMTSISTPATPASSNSILIHGGPETPATPSNSGTIHSMNHHSPHVTTTAATSLASAQLTNSSTSSGSNQNNSAVDHQPLSNGSASAGSITSTSTLTPSGQSLGSVGMGGDSRCNTAPLQMTNCNGTMGGNLDDLMTLAGGSSSGGGGVNHQQNNKFNHNNNQQHHHNNNNPHSLLIDEKNEILMNKLMMDSGESLLMRDHHQQQQQQHGTGNPVDHSLELALEEVEWKQQLEVSRGKSEHLANFLNEPALNTNKKSHHYNQTGSSSTSLLGGAAGVGRLAGQTTKIINNNNNHPGNKMLSGGLNAQSDDELLIGGSDQIINSPPSQQHDDSSLGCDGSQNLTDQLDQFANYLDSDTADNGAGLPPDDSILDLFER